MASSSKRFCFVDLPSLPITTYVGMDKIELFACFSVYYTAFERSFFKKTLSLPQDLE